jgi:hypothetical protein
MNKRIARKLKVGQAVKTPTGKVREIKGIIQWDERTPGGKFPLFELKGEKVPMSYKVLTALDVPANSGPEDVLRLLLIFEQIKLDIAHPNDFKSDAHRDHCIRIRCNEALAPYGR